MCTELPPDSQADSGKGPVLRARSLETGPTEEPFAERPPIAGEPISLVLPVFNAGRHIEEVLIGWATQLDGLNREYEILLVDDGSTDQTLAHAEGLAHRIPRLRILRHPARSGFGAALRTGFQFARFPLFCSTLGNGRYQAADLDRFLKWIDRVDLVAGYRVGPGGRRLRGNTSRWNWWLARVLFALRLRDPGGWFLLARRTIFQRIPIQSNGAFARLEVLAKANFLGCLMSEVPVRYLVNPRSKSDGLWADWPEVMRMLRHPDFGPRMLPAAVPT